jgi:hypothetical protein
LVSINLFWLLVCGCAFVTNIHSYCTGV